MDKEDINPEECALPTGHIKYNNYSPQVNGIGDIEEQYLNKTNKEDTVLDGLESNLNPKNENSGDSVLKSYNLNELDNKIEQNVLIDQNNSDFDTNTDSIPSHEKFIIVIAFILCFLSNCVGHIIREPLFTTKVNIQKSFGSSTLQLAYLDLSYMLFYGIGQMITPIVFPRSHIIMFVCFFHLLIGFCHFFLYIIENLSGFIAIYGVTGFSCAILWLSLYNDLHSWLPLKFRLIMITFWCASSEIGLILGTIMCAHIQTESRWKVLFLITSLVNFGVGLLLFTCYIKPKLNSEHINVNEMYIPREKLFDPMNIAKENYRKIVDGFISLYGNAPVELELSTLPTFDMETEQQSNIRGVSGFPNRLFKCLFQAISRYFKRTYKLGSKVIKGHVDVLNRVKHLNLYVLGYTSLKCVRDCFAFWISFYLTTNLKYSIQNGIYTTLVFQIGSCAASLVSGILSKLIMKNYHMTSCTISALFSFLVLSSFYFIDMRKMLVCFSYVFMVGFTTNCAEVLITTRGVKSLCEQNDEQGENDYTVSLGSIFSFSTFLYVVLGYVSIFIAHHFGWNYTFLYLSFTMLLSTWALGVPSKGEIKRIKELVL